MPSRAFPIVAADGFDSDSPLKIDELEILHKLYGTIITTEEVAIEFGLPLPSWIEIKQPATKIINQ